MFFTWHVFVQKSNRGMRDSELAVPTFAITRPTIKMKQYGSALRRGFVQSKYVRRQHFHPLTDSNFALTCLY